MTTRDASCQGYTFKYAAKRKALKNQQVYYRIRGRHGVYIFTKAELDRGLDRENEGASGEILPEKAYEEEYR